MTRVTEHLSVEEFACRDGTPYPARWVDTRLRRLCEALEELRATCLEVVGPTDSTGRRLRCRLRVLSGYRTPAYNRKIGGARKSRHMSGDAADVVFEWWSEDAQKWVLLFPERVHELALALLDVGAVRLGGLGAYPGFTHVDVRPGGRLARWRGKRVES